MSNMKVLLAIENRGKAVPYESEKHKDSENYGFKALKGRMAEAEEVPEAKGFAEIISILKSINEEASPFFSVGCEKSFNKSKDGYWAKGYIEFSFNYKELIIDAVQYFPLFFHFHRYVEDFANSNSVQFLWELQPAHFIEADVDGFTVCVWITTGELKTLDAARALWLSAVKSLEGYLLTVGRPRRGTEIYAHNT
ncbi:MAG: hypothetical protein PSX71_03790 [bacterium]|nr:hypothetical protein [bacterium]